MNAHKALPASLQRVLAVLFWLLVWQAASALIGREILLASPWKVCVTLSQLVLQADFWQVTAQSFGRIAAGFALAAVLGVLLAVWAAACRSVRLLLSPLMQLMKAVPVASFIILVLLWVGSKGLSVVISFLMVLPILYTNTLQGIMQTDPQLLEMTRVFHFRWYHTLRTVYLPAVLPYFSSACSVALGLAFKSGIAAEVIGLPDGSIGEKLYQAKIYLSTGEVLAWTVVIIFLSVCFEQLVGLLLRLLQRRLIA